MGRDSGWSRAPWDGKFLWEFLEDRGTISGSTCIAARGTSPPRESVHLWWRGVAATARPWGAFWAVAPLSGAIWPICGICGQWLLPAGGGQPHRRLQGCQRRPSLGCCSPHSSPPVRALRCWRARHGRGGWCSRDVAQRGRRRGPERARLPARGGGVPGGRCAEPRARLADTRGACYVPCALE